MGKYSEDLFSELFDGLDNLSVPTSVRSKSKVRFDMPNEPESQESFGDPLDNLTHPELLDAVRSRDAKIQQQQQQIEALRLELRDALKSRDAEIQQQHQQIETLGMQLQILTRKQSAPLNSAPVVTTETTTTLTPTWSRPVIALPQLVSSMATTISVAPVPDHRPVVPKPDKMTEKPRHQCVESRRTRVPPGFAPLPVRVNYITHTTSAPKPCVTKSATKIARPQPREVIRGDHFSSLPENRAPPFDRHCSHCWRSGHTSVSCFRRLNRCLRCGSGDHRIARCPQPASQARRRKYPHVNHRGQRSPGYLGKQRPEHQGQRRSEYGNRHRPSRSYGNLSGRYVNNSMSERNSQRSNSEMCCQPLKRNRGTLTSVSSRNSLGLLPAKRKPLNP